MKRWKNYYNALPVNFIRFLKLVISLLLLSYLFSKISFYEVFKVLSNANLYYLAFAIVLIILNVFIIAERWRLLLSSKIRGITLKETVVLYFIGNFFNTFSPGTIGGDGLRAYQLYKHNNVDKIETVSSVLLDRLIGFVSLSVITGIALILDFDRVKNIEGIKILIIFVFFSIFFFFSFFNSCIFKKIQKIFISSYKLDRFHLISKVNKIYISIYQYKVDKSILIKALFISFVNNIITIINIYIISLALGLQIDIFYFFIFVPIITFIISIPISIQGLGVREVAFVFFYTQVGATVPQAVSLSITYYLLIISANSIGGFIYAARSIRDNYT